ncbi:hypothetical protein [Lactovum odontotermitis]
MKFLTEYDLRLKYQEHPFDDFTVTGETRLTPGARQFLIDRKIKIIDEKEEKEKFQKDVLKKNKDPISVGKSNEDGLAALDWLLLRSEILNSAAQTEKTDLLLAQELCALQECLSLFSQGCAFTLPQPPQPARAVDEKWLEDRLSSVSMYLQSTNGVILTVLYSLYFKMKKIELHVTGERKVDFRSFSDFIAQLIAHYLEGSGYEN